MILQDPDDEERALHLEELHVVTFLPMQASSKEQEKHEV